MKITIKKNRSVYPYRIKVSNQYENKTNFIEFDLDVPNGNKYLFVEIEGKTVPYPLSEKFEIGAGLSWTAGEHRALVAVSNVEIVDNINKENTLFLSDEFVLVVDENFINPDDVSGGGLPEPLKVVYDELLTLKNDLESKVQSGYFEGADGESAYQIAVRLGFKGTEQEWIESLRYDHSDEFSKLATQVNQNAQDAQTLAQNAKDSEVNAETSETKAKTSETNAKDSETASKESETNAKASETVANTKAQEASESAQTATEKATQATASADNAKVSETNAKSSETNAKTSETNASKSAEAAKASETATGQVVADATEQADRAKTEADRAKTNADTVASSTQKIDKNESDITQLKQDLLIYMKMNRTGKLYGVKKWKSNINPTSSCDKLYDNVGLVCEPSTDTVEGRDDYEDINIFKWKRVNYKRYDDGFAYPTAFEGDENFNNVDNADVGNIYQTFYYKEIDKNDYTELIISDTPNHALGLAPWEESVRADGTVMPYYIMSTYDASLGSDGLLHSLPNKKIEANISHNKMISEFQKKGKGYWGAGSNRMTFAQIFSQIKYGTKDIQSVMAGCTGYASQLKATIQSSDKTNVFPILKSQASLIEIGSRVSVGYGRVDSGNKINLDRSIATVHAYADQVKVLKIEDAEDGTNSLVYLDCEPFNTMPIDHSESGLKLDITLSTMPWHSGSTDAVIKHHDGSLRSNSNSRMPCRIQGIEYFCGKYIIASDTVIFNQPDTSKEVYFAPRGIKHTDNDSLIKQTYTKIGKIPPAKAGNGADYWVGDVEINHGAWFPSAELATRNSYKDRLYFGGNATSGSREYLQGGDLGGWSLAGLSYLYLWSWLGGAFWSFACAD